MHLAMAILATAAVASPPCASRDAAALEWLAGTWLEEKGESWTKETWTPPRCGVLMGLNESGKGDTVTGFELLRIAPGQDGTLHFFGSPGGKPAVAFKMVRLDGQSATFENPAHDYPVRIRYWREGEVLNAETTGGGGAKRMRWTFRRK